MRLEWQVEVGERSVLILVDLEEVWILDAIGRVAELPELDDIGKAELIKVDGDLIRV